MFRARGAKEVREWAGALNGEASRVARRGGEPAAGSPGGTRPERWECQSRPPSAQLGIPAGRTQKWALQMWAAPGAPLAHFHSLFKLSKRGTAVPKLSSGSNQSHRVWERLRGNQPIRNSCLSRVQPGFHPAFGPGDADVACKLLKIRCRPTGPPGRLVRTTEATG